MLSDRRMAPLFSAWGGCRCLDQRAARNGSFANEDSLGRAVMRDDRGKAAIVEAGAGLKELHDETGARKG